MSTVGIVFVSIGASISLIGIILLFTTVLRDKTGWSVFFGNKNKIAEAKEIEYEDNQKRILDSVIELHDKVTHLLLSASNELASLYEGDQTNIADDVSKYREKFQQRVSYIMDFVDTTEYGLIMSNERQNNVDFIIKIITTKTPTSWRGDKELQGAMYALELEIERNKKRNNYENTNSM